MDAVTLSRKISSATSPRYISARTISLKGMSTVEVIVLATGPRCTLALKHLLANFHSAATIYCQSITSPQFRITFVSPAEIQTSVEYVNHQAGNRTVELTAVGGGYFWF
jgi:hypothetical protein